MRKEFKNDLGRKMFMISVGVAIFVLKSCEAQNWSPTTEVSGPDAAVLIGELSNASILDGAYNIRYDTETTTIFAVCVFSQAVVAVDANDPTDLKLLGYIRGDAESDPDDPLNSQLVAMEYDATNKRIYTSAFSVATFVIVDVSIPTDPMTLGFVEDATVLDGPAGLSYDEDTDVVIVTARSSNGLVTVNVSDPTAPFIIGSIQDDEHLVGAHSMAWDSVNKLAYVGAYAIDAFTIVDVSDPTNPMVLSSIRDSTYNDWPVSIVYDAFKSRCLVAAANSSSVAAFDVSDPNNPTLLGGYKDEINLVDPAGISYDSNTERLFIASVISNNIVVVDFSSSTEPTLLGEPAYYNGSRDVFYDSDRELAFAVSQWASPEVAAFDFSNTVLGGSGDETCAMESDCSHLGQTCACSGRRSLSNEGRKLKFGHFTADDCLCSW